MPAEVTLPDDIDTRAFEGLVGYHARRAALAIIEVFVRDMAVYDLRPVAFSILLLVDHNPGITSAQLCSQLNIQSSNLVGLIKELLQRQLIERRPHPSDGRAMGLHLSEAGQALTRDAARTAAESELKATAQLSDTERQTVVRLLKKIYR
jgi:DNA-binding MarR family transcriptional regulator